MKTVTIVIAVMCVALQAAALPAAASTESQSTAAAIALKQDMRKLWTDHVVWTREYIVAALGDQPDAQAAANRLMRNQEDIGNAVGKIYGDAAGKQLTALLSNSPISSLIERSQRALVSGPQLQRVPIDPTFALPGWSHFLPNRIVPVSAAPRLAITGATITRWFPTARSISAPVTMPAGTNSERPPGTQISAHSELPLSVPQARLARISVAPSPIAPPISAPSRTESRFGVD
jgi:hypothetical protein